MDVHASTIPVLGLRTRVLGSAETSGRDPVVMIHGVGAWAENWREVMEPIAQTGRRAIAVDLPGFGESESAGAVRHFGPEDAFYPRFVTALMDELGVASAHIVGSSMGGAVAYLTAVSSPARTRSLVLVASGGLGTDIPLAFRLATLPGMRALVRLFGRPAQGRDFLRTCFHDPTRIPAALSEESERYGFRSYPELVRVLRSGATIRGVRADLRRHWVARAERYRGPVLVVWGREDAVLPIGHLEGAKEVFSQAEVRIVERCGHLPMVERPDEFLAALLPFLDRAEARAAA